jgi:LPXTG-motif cell wall-anchored protein
MTKRKPTTGKAVIAGAAIGSAAIAAALLYASRRKKKHKPTQPGPIPSGEKPETD